MSANTTRQGSASFTIVIGAVLALIAGGITLTFVVYPMINALTASPLFTGFETTAGSRLGTVITAIWKSWGLIAILAILAFVWIRTRQ